jgi:RNA polymerase sigma-70 factor (ECF subfamily)
MREAGRGPARGGGSSDAELVRRARLGETAALDELVQRHFKPVYNLAYRLAGNHDDASDIAQEAFLRVHHALPNFRGEANFTTWLYRIVYNVFLDERKKQKVRAHTSLEEDVELEDSSVARQIQDPSPGPDFMVIRGERAEIVQQAVLSLPRNQRLMLGLYHFQGRSYEEIAAIMDLPIGTVKSRLNRARLALKAKLQSYRELLDT